MKLLGQLGVILAFSYAGHLLAAGLSIPLPASVIGILLLLAGMRTGWIAECRIDQVAHFLLANMAFFFIPSAVEIIENIGVIRPILFRVILICVLSTAATFFVSYMAVCALQKIAGKKDAQ